MKKEEFEELEELSTKVYDQDFRTFLGMIARNIDHKESSKIAWKLYEKIKKEKFGVGTFALAHVLLMVLLDVDYPKLIDEINKEKVGG